VAGIGLGLAVPINAATRRVIAALMTDGRVRRAYLGIAGAPRPLPPALRERWGASPAWSSWRWSRAAPRTPPACARATCWSSSPASGSPGVQDVQRRMEDEVIGTRLVVTVLRDGLERQLQVVPRELEG
jgi:S1-C subfamily serine protease